MANINNNKRTILDLKLKNDEYWDFMLSKDLLQPISLPEKELNGLASFIDFRDSKCFLKNGEIESLSVWKNSINDGVVLKNIGFTGIDNGFIKYRKDRISNEEFLRIYLNSNYEIPSERKSFFLSPVSSNTLNYNIPLPIKENDKNFVKLNGGFYQGFFKLHNSNYQTLPLYLGNEWNVFFRLRPTDDPILENTLNSLYPENSGMFFYIGTRAENKFWTLYNKNKDNIEFVKRDSYNEDDYFGDAYNENSVIDEFYLMDTSSYYCEDCEETFEDYFSDAYFDYESPEYAIMDEYVSEDISLRNLDLETYNGYDLDKKGYYEIETDNKFLLFNRTDSGCTVDTWEDDTSYTLIGRDDYDADNYFLLFNRTDNGYTINTIQEYLEDNRKEYNVYNDICNNALGFKINEDGSITYRYLVRDCEGKNEISVIEETSKSNIISKNEWNDITIKIKLLDYDNSNCYVSNGRGTMKIYIYVNGFLKLVSKELPEICLKPMDDVSEKQEGVPYNISIGGGSQGLMDTVDIDYYKIPEYILPIEKYFAGTFIGDIEQFKFYDYPLDFYSIQNLNKGI